MWEKYKSDAFLEMGREQISFFKTVSAKESEFPKEKKRFRIKNMVKRKTE